jgi:hypothetical protein
MAGKVHDFLPITNAERLEAATAYVAEQAARLARVVLGRELPLDTICFFSHSPEEYAFLLDAVRAKGPESALTHGATTYADTDCMVGPHRIRLFGVREADETRPEVGYGDYPVDDYAALLASVQDNQYAHEIISGRGKSLLELKHPDFDVRGYALASEEHS